MHNHVDNLQKIPPLPTTHPKKSVQWHPLLSVATLEAVQLCAVFYWLAHCRTGLRVTPQPEYGCCLSCAGKRKHHGNESLYNTQNGWFKRAYSRHIHKPHPPLQRHEPFQSVSVVPTHITGKIQTISRCKKSTPTDTHGFTLHVLQKFRVTRIFQWPTELFCGGVIWALHTYQSKDWTVEWRIHTLPYVIICVKYKQN